jgi:catechol 2,3-dioxygenase-like lactoylglutathione lyase family enzyme
MASVLGAAGPVAFVATTDAERARGFYEGTLGLSLVADEEFALVFDLLGTMLRVTRVERLEPQPFTVLGWRVADAEESVRALTARGVTFERYSSLEQDDLGIWVAPAGSRVAWFKDPDGNVLSVSQY